MQHTQRCADWGDECPAHGVGSVEDGAPVGSPQWPRRGPAVWLFLAAFPASQPRRGLPPRCCSFLENPQETRTRTSCPCA